MEKREKLEIDIELKDLFFEFLRKWRVIVCCALIGGILFGAIACVSDYKNANAPVNPAIEAEDTVEDVTAELNIDELEEVIAAVQLKAQIDAKSQYISKSIVMQINPFSTDKIMLEYRVDGEDAAIALNSYQTWIENGGFLSTEMTDEEKIYLGELVTADIGTQSFIIQIIHNDADACANLAAEVKAAFTQYMASLKNSGVLHETYLLQETQSVVVDNELHQFQDEYLNENIEDQESLAKMKADMSAEQVTAYLEMERDVFDRGEISETEAASESQDINTEAEAARVSVDIKQILLGMIIGTVLAVVYVFMAYLLTGKLRTAGEVEKLYGVKMLGTMQDTQQKKKIFAAVDKFLCKLEYSKSGKTDVKEEQKLVAASIYIQCQKYDTTTVYACGSRIANIPSDIINTLKKELEALGITLESGMDITSNADALLKAAKAGNALLIEERRNSAYKDILKGMQMCGNNHIRVLGIVVVE